MFVPTETFGLNGHGEFSFSEFVVPQRKSLFGTVGGPTQSAGVVASPAISVSPLPFHRKTRIVAFAPLDWKSVSTSTSPSTCEPLNDPFARGATLLWKNQTPSVAVPLPSKRSAPK